VNRQSLTAVQPRHCHRCTDGAPDQCDARSIPVDWPDSFAPVGRRVKFLDTYPHLLLSFLALYAHLFLRVKAALFCFTRLEAKAWVGGFTHSQLVWEMVRNFAIL
jgi:hypothetical protein